MKSTFYNEKETKNKLVEFIASAEILSMSKQCRQFEKSFANKQKRKYAVFVSSGSMANLLLIQTLLNLDRLKKGDKIGISSLTWATNVMPLLQFGLHPVAMDCSLETLNVSLEELGKYAGEIKGLFLTNVLGFSDNIKEIQEICKKNGILFLEDNCESLGSSVQGTLLGNFGLASTFSFFVGHHLSTVEGGMVCTDDEDLYNMLVMVRAHGWNRNLSAEKQKQLREQNDKENTVDDFYDRYTFYDLAYNGRPTEINGFLGNEQLQYWDEIVSKREGNFKKFQKAIKENDHFYHLNLEHMDIISNFAMPLVCKSKDVCEKYKNKFSKSKIEIRPIISGDITRQPFYKKYVKEESHCPNARLVHDNGFYFPNNPEITDTEAGLLRSLLLP